MKKIIQMVLFVGILLLSSVQLQIVVANDGINKEELFQQEIENYLPPYLLIDLTVNVTTSSVLSGVNLIGDDLRENGWAVANIKLQASERKAFITPIRYLDVGVLGMKVQTLETFEVVVEYPYSVAQTAVQSDIAEIGYEDRDSDDMTVRDIIAEYNLVKTQTKLAYKITNFAANELKPKEGNIDYGTESSDQDRLSFSIFTATKDINETAYIWSADALGLDNTTQINEMNVTTSEIEYKFPYKYRETLSSALVDGLYNLNFRKALTAVEDTAFNTYESFKDEQSSLNSKKPKNIIFDIGPFALVGNNFKDVSIRIGNGFEVPISTIMIIIGFFVIVGVLVMALLFFSKKSSRAEDKKDEQYFRQQQRQRNWTRGQKRL